MRANHYPTPTDLIALLKDEGHTCDPEDSKRALRVAFLAAELITTEPVIPRKVELKVLFGNTHLPVAMPHYPIRNLTIEGRTKYDWYVMGDTGHVQAELSMRNYSVSYEVGYEEGRLPATLQRLLELLALQDLKPNPERLQEITDCVGTLRFYRGKLTARRNAIESYQAVREVPG